MTESTENNAKQLRVLVVEDEALFAKAVAKHLRNAHFDCVIADTLEKARGLVSSFDPDLILLDMRLPDGTGLDFLTELGESDATDVPVIVLTAFGDLEDAVTAMKLNAADYLKKPIDLDELLLVVEKVLDRVRVGRQLDYSRQRESLSLEGQELLGESPPIERVREQLAQVSTLTAAGDEATPTVLISGETGTGKDLAARLLHRQSARRDRPFVHVDCTALPKELIESELFGHEKGAFTSAHSARTGLIEAAEDGTVFLDEIAELPLDLQPKLLAVLERHKVRRVGSSRERPVNAWFIAGTNRPLEEMVQDGSFRSDLYYRLKVLTIAMPPLRERGDDIVLLARHFAAHTARRFGLEEPELDPSATDALRAYGWPGNVRELAHLIERAVLLSGGKQLTSGALMLDVGDKASTDHPPRLPSLDGMTLEEVEIMMIERALERTGGNVSKAARELGITRMALRYRIKQHGISAGR